VVIVGRVLAAAPVFAGVGNAGPGGGWHRVSIERRQGSVKATLSYQVRADPEQRGVSYYRRLTLSMSRAGSTLTAPLSGAIAGRPTLGLGDVWDGSAPEALVEAPTGGNLCCDRLRVLVLEGAALETGGTERILSLDFPTYGWHEQRHDGTVYFVTSDWTFDGAFTDCADGSAPIRIFAIDKAGRRFVEVTRARPDLIIADASKQWSQYVSERGNVGLLAAWCAERVPARQEEPLRSKARDRARAWLPHRLVSRRGEEVHRGPPPLARQVGLRPGLTG